MTKIFFLIMMILPLQRAQAYGCHLDGRFQQITYDIFGQSWAEAETSYGLGIYDKTGNLICDEYVQGAQKIYPASSIKTLIAVAILKQMELGRFDFDTKIKIDQVNAGAECKYWNCEMYGPGKFQTVRTLLWDMITVSNNLATNQLIDLATKDYINKVANQLGTPALRVYRKVYDDVNPEPELKQRNEANAHDMVLLYREVATGHMRFLRNDLRLHLVGLLGNQKYNSMLNAHFPSGVKFYHKTGNTSTVTSDGGFYVLPNGFSVVLVGLQNFNRYRVCKRVDDACIWRTGFWSLDQIGARTFKLVSEEIK